MTRRRLVALVSASVILGVLILIGAAVLATTRTDFGRERIRRLALARASLALGKNGKLYLGKITGSIFTEIIIDSVSLRDAEDSLFVATGPVRLRFDPRDLLDNRIHLAVLDITRPRIYLRRHADDTWNFRTIFGQPAKKKVIRTAGLGDYIVADSVALHEGAFWFTERWDPDDSLKGPRRDSAIKAAMAKPWPEVRMTKEGPKRTRRWTHLELRAPWVRIAHPDSAGQMIDLALLSAVESDPPTELKNLRGTVRIQGDTVWAALSHFDFPGTTGKARVHVWWGGDKPTQLDVTAQADSVSLSDFAWVYENLPRKGGGRVEVRVRNDPRNLHVIDYALKNMDLRTARSHLRGDMTFGIGWPTLVIKDVAVTLEPADFDLIRAFNGGAFPVDFQGRFTGAIHAAGGPIERWKVDSANITYADAHVPGALSHLTARGEIDLSSPADARFHGLDVRLDALDLRTITYLFPAFPRLGGTITGRATLDSIWTDVRFRDADVSHHDGPDAPSRVTGSGRVTSSGRSTAFDVTLDAAPLSFSSLQRSYSWIPLRGTFTGPLRVEGITDRLTLQTRLTGAAGTLTVDELVDIDPLGGQGAKGTVRASGVDIAQLLERPSIPATHVNALITNDVHGDSLASMQGRAEITIDTSRVAEIWVPHATAHAAVSGGHLHFDSLTLSSTGVRAHGSGMLGLKIGAQDSMFFTVDVDSLGGLRSVLIPEARAAVDSAHPLLARAGRDSLAGSLSVSGVLAGSVADSFTASATFLGEHLAWGTNSAARMAGDFEFHGLPAAPHGPLWARFDSATVMGIGVDTVHTTMTLNGSGQGTLGFAMVTDRAAGTVRGGGRLTFAMVGDTTRLALDSLSFFAGAHAWRLFAPSHFLSTPAGDVLDSLRLVSAGGTIALKVDLPVSGAVSGAATVDSLALSDLGAILQSRSPLAGLMTGDAQLSGTRAAPVIRAGARFRGARYGQYSLPYFGVDADYSARRLAMRLDVFDRSQTLGSFALTVPADLAFLPVKERFPVAPITGRLAADSVDLTAFAALSPLLSQPAGTASADIVISGTRVRPLLDGHLRLQDGEVGLPRLGIRLSGVQAGVRFAADGIHIDTLSMRSGAVRGNFLSLTGSLRAPSLLDLLSDRTALELDLRMKARNFQLIDSRRLARVEITDNIALTGKFTGATLSGTITVDKADFYLTELSRKNSVVDLDDPELFTDPAIAGARALRSPFAPDVRAAISGLRVEGLDVALGDQVWLRSAESEIKLGGAVQITGSGAQTLTGKIDVRRGSYRLDLGIVQRTFQVDSGNVSFYGDVEAGGKLDVWASSTVRQANRIGEDVRILAHITGTTSSPHAEFTSGERYALSQTEILSYLIFGQPNFGGANDVQSRNAVASAMLPSLGTVLESAITNQIRFVDQVTIQTGGTSASASDPNAQNNALYGSRFGFGKQIGDKTYVSANAGLCWLQSSSSSQTSFSQSLAVSVEQRLSDRFFLQASMEPGSAALLCKPDGGIGSRPQQYGFDLFREWSF